MSSMVLQVNDWQWLNVHDALSLDAGTPITIFNKSGFTNLFLVTSATQPIVKNGMPLFEREHQFVNPEDGEFLWAITIQGMAEIYATDDAVTGALPDYVFTGNNQVTSRIRVDPGQTSFYEGREFRVNEEFSIPVGGRLLWKYVLGVNTILTLSSLEIDQGGAIYRVYTQAQTTEISPFDVAVPIYRKNAMTDAPLYVTQNQIFKGGDATFTGISNSTTRVRTAAGNGNRSSAVDNESQQRGLPPSIAYIEISALDGVNVETLGVLKQEWQEDI